MVVVPSERFCITMWLPRCRTDTNPCASRIVHASRPESLRSLPNQNLDARDEHLVVQPTRNLALSRGLEEQLQRLYQVGPRILDRLTLARDVELRTERDVRIVLTLDDGGELALGLHSAILAWRPCTDLVGGRPMTRIATTSSKGAAAARRK